MRRYLDDERINIARGLVAGTKFVHKFGAVPAMSTNTTGTIWDINDTLYPWSVFDTPSTVTVPAVAAGDNGNIIRVYGLDANYNEVTEELVLSSSGSVTGTQVFKRIFRAYFFNGGATNVGNVDIQVDSTTVCRISEGKAQTLMGVYTIPAGYTGYLMKGNASIEYGGDATIDMYVRYGGTSAFRIGHTGETAGTGQPYNYDFAIPVPIPEKSDIDVRASVRSNNSRVSCAFDLILVANPE